MHHVVRGQLTCKVWQSLDRIYFKCILLVETINGWRREGNRSIRRNSLIMSFRNSQKLAVLILTKHCLSTGDIWQCAYTVVGRATQRTWLRWGGWLPTCRSRSKGIWDCCIQMLWVSPSFYTLPCSKLIAVRVFCCCCFLFFFLLFQLVRKYFLRSFFFFFF